MNKLNIIVSGIVKNNPTFVLVLGMCPTLGTTTSAGNGMGMGLALYASLGVFIPLIVVNCIILGRAEAFASKNSPLDSILDGVGIGLGFTLALTAVGAVREILGSGAIFGVSLGTADFMPLIFVLAPGAFLVLGYLMVLFNKLAKK